MHLIYMDEVKYQLPSQPHYWQCGCAVDKPALEFADAEARSAAEWYFSNTDLRATTELHARHIVNGTAHFNGHDVARRIELCHKLIDCLCGHESIHRIVVRIDPSKIVYGKDPAETAFILFGGKK